MLLLLHHPDRRFFPPDGDPRHGPRCRAAVAGVSTFGLQVFLASLSMLFATTLVGYAHTRSRVADWSGYRIPGLELRLAAATAALALCSLSLLRARAASRRRSVAGIRRSLSLATLSALLFLAIQTSTWLRLAEVHGGLRGSADVSLFLFYALTFLHALHVLGGLPPLLLARRRAGRYVTAARPGLKNVALYWHYVDAIWLLIAAALLLA